MKKCYKCKRELDKSDFYKNKTKKDGLNHYCKSCEKLRHSIYYEKNREELLNQKGEYYQHIKKQYKIKNQNYYNKKRQEILLQKREYYQKNRGKILHHSHKYRQKPEVKKRIKSYREKNKIKRKIYNENHPEINKKAKRTRRLKKKQLFEDFTIEEWKQKVAETNSICPICNRPYTKVYPFCVTLDHTPSISRATMGFHYNISDIMPMCGQCNLSKGNKF